MEKSLFLAALASSLFMTGLIWFVQVVHYPLFAKVGPEAFSIYESLHTQKTGLVVGPVMLVELLASLLWMLVGLEQGHSWQAWTIAALLGVIWLSTFFIQVPIHNELIQSFEPEKVRRLVSSNWLRTFAWTTKSGFMMWILIKSHLFFMQT
ncbi:MAG: hypothetical protein AAF399_23100 [Bacteroidota bacterium]